MCSVIPVGENTPRGNGAWGGDHTGPEHGLQPSTAPLRPTPFPGSVTFPTAPLGPGLQAQAQAQPQPQL